MVCTKTQKYMMQTAKHIYETESIPDKSILCDIRNRNAKETLSSSGWPRSYSPDVDNCPLCATVLPPITKKRRKSREDRCLLISREHILEIDVYTKQCRSCFLVIRPDTMGSGLLNIGDHTLITLDIFFSLQNTIR